MKLDYRLTHVFVVISIKDEELSSYYLLHWFFIFVYLPKNYASEQEKDIQEMCELIVGV